jgi:hypothetical protein
MYWVRSAFVDFFGRSTSRWPATGERFGGVFLEVTPFGAARFLRFITTTPKACFEP